MNSKLMPPFSTECIVSSLVKLHNRADDVKIGREAV